MGLAVIAPWPGALRCASSHGGYVEATVSCGGQFDVRFDLAAGIMLQRRRFRLTDRLADSGASILWWPDGDGTWP